MNIVILQGRLTADPELTKTTSGIAVTRFSIAVQRPTKNENEEFEIDFINCVAWRNAAEHISKYFTKGKGIIVKGRMQTRNYTKTDGTKAYVTEVIVEQTYFPVGGANSDKKEEPKMVEIEDDDLPF